MRFTKRIPFQIFLLILFAGIVGISGMLIMQHNIKEISSNYELTMEGCLQDRLDMYDLCRLMNRHHITVSWYALTDDPNDKKRYEEDSEKLKIEIMEILDKLDASISGSEKERVFHTVYSNTINYFSNAENVFTMSIESGAEMAKFYITSYLANFINNVNADTDIMDGYVTEEMNAIGEMTERSISIALTSETVCIICIVIAVVVCIVLCVGITSRLENYKNHLEKENELKTLKLIEHNKRMLDIQDNTVIGMASLIESRDHDTGEHVKRTGKYVELLVRAAQRASYCADILTENYADLIVKAAPLHDIGKIAVSDVILQKPGRLTAGEFEQMKSHTTAGGRIVVEVLGSIEEKEYIDIASQIARSHHEKWDGSGYPSGLRGENIPIGARIMAVADVFDALVSERCYKPPMPVDKAFRIIEESGGSHFDPELAKLFCEIRSDVENVLKK